MFDKVFVHLEEENLRVCLLLGGHFSGCDPNLGASILVSDVKKELNYEKTCQSKSVFATKRTFSRTNFCNFFFCNLALFVSFLHAFFVFSYFF